MSPGDLRAAHACRLRGDLDEALRRYTGVVGQDAVSAAIWTAGIDMMRGRFADAIESTSDIRGSLDPADRISQAALYRLTALVHRYSFNHGVALQSLELARAICPDTEALIRLSADEAQLSATQQPQQTVDIIEQAARLGMRRVEAATRLAVSTSYVRLGEFGQAQRHLAYGLELLRQHGSRTARARGHWYEAVLLFVRSRPSDGLRMLRRCVSELEQMGAYPSWILVCARLADRVGWPHHDLEASARRALASLQPVQGIQALEAGVQSTLEYVLGDGLSSLYERAAGASAYAVGFHNRNVRVDDRVVRIPIAGSQPTDLVTWDEALVLAAIRGRVSSAPDLCAVCSAPRFQVHHFVEGDRMVDIAPRGSSLPSGFVPQIAGLFAELRRIPLRDLPPLPVGWPEDGDCEGFARLLAAIVERIHERNRVSCRRLWQALGFPEDPLAQLDWATLSRRPFQLLHADLHRANMLWTTNGRLTVLDWEFATWGDPVYEIAAHIHKTGYVPAQADEILRAWLRDRPIDSVEAVRHDVDLYIACERIKAVLIDSARYTEIVRNAGESESHVHALVEDLTMKLGEAHTTWETGLRLSYTDVRSALYSE